MITPTFTARQISKAIGRPKQWVQHHHLAGVLSAGFENIGGNRTQVWEFCALPAVLQVELESIAKARGFADAHALLTYEQEHQQAVLQPGQQALADATKLCEVFSPFLQVKDTDSRTQAQFESAGVAAYAKVFGSVITGRWFRELFTKINRQDGGKNDFQNPKTYLGVRATHPSARREKPVKPNFDHADLGQPLSFKDPENPTLIERTYGYECSFLHYEDLLATHPAKRIQIVQSVHHFIWTKAPALAASLEALKRNWHRKYARWIAAGRKPSGHQDQRPAKSGFFRAPKLSDQAKDVITASGVLRRGGRVATAWREYVRGEIPGITPDPALAEYYTANPADKSYVPRHVAESVKYEIAAMKARHHGRYQHEQSGHLSLDDSGIYARTCWSSDDGTLPVYFFIPSPSRPVLMRGQFLLTVDHRSRRILGFCLIPERSYDSLRIRSHFTSVTKEHGLPNIVIWERGLWQKSKLVKGSADADLVPPEEAELGLRELGVQFVHRHSPKGKIVERVLGLLQDRMEGEPGYCGRNEQIERFEDFNRLKADVEAGRVHPGGVLYSFEQWTDRLHEICADYNRTAYGRDTKLAGLSPDEAYETMQNPNDPPVKFDESTIHLLSTHRRAVTVTANGIDFRCGKRHFVYRNQKTGELIGRKVLIWFDPESPDVGYVSDLKRKNPFAVELEIPVPTVGATRDQLGQAMSQLRAHQAPIRARYRTLKTNFQQAFRRNIVSPEIVDTGKAFADGAEQIRSHRAAQTRTIARAQRAGIALDHAPRNPDRVLHGLELEKNARAKIAASQNEGAL